MLRLASLLIAPASYAGRWAVPGSTPERVLDPEFYRSMAAGAERARLHYLFLPDKYTVTGTSRDVLAHGVNVWPEPITLLSMLAATTEHIGLAATVSTTYHEPFHVARMFASLDHLSRGRAAWNLVTSIGDLDAHNFLPTHRPPEDLRHAHSEEFLDIVLRLWDSWEDTAIAPDRDSGSYADPAKVHAVDHGSEWFRVAGPLNVARPPQGHPVLIQAGASEQFLDRAAVGADVVFTMLGTLAAAKSFTGKLKERTGRAGRDPDSVLVLPGLSIFVADTDAEAEATAREWSGQAPGHCTFAGTPTTVADRIAEWHAANAVDGFTLIPNRLPKDLADFTELVVPELRRRGIFRDQHHGGTLREELGLPRPANRHTAR